MRRLVAVGPRGRPRHLREIAGAGLLHAADGGCGVEPGLADVGLVLDGRPFRRVELQDRAIPGVAALARSEAVDGAGGMLGSCSGVVSAAEPDTRAGTGGVAAAGADAAVGPAASVPVTCRSTDARGAARWKIVIGGVPLSTIPAETLWLIPQASTSFPTKRPWPRTTRGARARPHV